MYAGGVGIMQQQPCITDCRARQFRHRRNNTHRLTGTAIPRRPRLRILSETRGCTEVPVGLRTRRRPVLQNMGNHPRRTRRIPEHLPAARLLHLPRRPTPTGQCRTQYPDRHPIPRLRRRKMVQPLPPGHLAPLLRRRTIQP